MSTVNASIDYITVQPEVTDLVTHQTTTITSEILNVFRGLLFGASVGASVKVDCYIPEISKTAAGAHGERHEWDVEKTVTPATQNAFAGASVSYTWEVVVTEEVFEEDFVASGKITVVNHNPEDAMTVALSDVLSDKTAATITACTGDADLTDGLTIAASGSSVCDYSATLSYTKVVDAPTNNTATAVLNNLSYSASVPIEWASTVIRGSATVTDDQIGLNETISDGDTFTGSETYTCSSTASDYAGDHHHLQRIQHRHRNLR